MKIPTALMSATSASSGYFRNRRHRSERASKIMLKRMETMPTLTAPLPTPLLPTPLLLSDKERTAHEGKKEEEEKGDEEFPWSGIETPTLNGQLPEKPKRGALAYFDFFNLNWPQVKKAEPTFTRIGTHERESERVRE